MYDVNLILTALFYGWYWKQLIFLPNDRRNTFNPSSGLDNFSTISTSQNQINNSGDDTSSNKSDHNNNSNITGILWDNDYIDIFNYNFITTTSGTKLDI